MGLWQDLRFALRSMIKAPSVAVVALLTLALGIGANTAIFSVVDAVLLRPLPFHEAGQLVQLRADFRGLGTQNLGFSYPEFEDLRDRSGIFDGVSVAWPAPANLTGGEHPERVDILGVSPNYFELLGVRPQLGRVFDSRDIAEGFAEAAVISDGLWHREFAADPGILGRKVRLDNDLYTIVGVAPADFRHPGPTNAQPIDFWVTAGFRANPFPPPVRNLRVLPGIIGRLKPGITPQQAQNMLQIFVENLRKQYGADYPMSSGWTLVAEPLKQVVVGNSQPLLVSMLLAVSLILLIACVNVAGLLLARASGRRREMAVRAALGASRGRLIRQLLTESAALSLAAALLGVTVAFLIEKSLIALLPDQITRVGQIRIDAPVLLFSTGIAVVAAVLFGLAPALQSSRANTEALKQEERSGDTSLQSRRMRKLLVGAEVALSVVLVVTAGLLLRTFWDLLHVNPGFSSNHVFTATVWLPVPNDPKTDVYQTNEQRAAFVREVLRRVHQIPGVESAAVASALPLRSQLFRQGFRVEGRPEEGDIPIASFVLVSPEFFRTLNARLVRGRMIQENDDKNTAPTIMVDEAAARVLWPGEDALGKRLRLGRNIIVNNKPAAPPWMTVVGVVNNIKFESLDEKNVPHIYASMYQVSGKLFRVLVKATGDPASIGRDIKDQVQSVDPNLPVSGVEALNEVVTDSLTDRRFAAGLIACFALLALGLAAIGVYGVASYTVAQRTKELGIRAALGATAADLVRIVMKDGMRPVLGGLVAGALCAPLLGRMVSSLLYGVHLLQPEIYLVSVVVLAGIGLLANYLPARRAGRVDPNRALRYE
ncbi:MAG TPA: ABC transporter permease [Candidatus Acidoferrales bacterium]|jgi:predicted permease|nr:ABC transporter permease [Candidatus Acidoferrales bacterium]